MLIRALRARWDALDPESAVAALVWFLGSPEIPVGCSMSNDTSCNFAPDEIPPSCFQRVTRGS